MTPEVGLLLGGLCFIALSAAFYALRGKMGRYRAISPEETRNSDALAAASALILGVAMTVLALTLMLVE